MNLPTMKIIPGKEGEKMNPSLRLSDYKDVIVDSNAGVIHAELTIKKLNQYLRSCKNITIL